MLESASPRVHVTKDPWTVAAGALCLTMPTYGLMSAWGLFQVYWQAHQLAGLAAQSPTAIPWIGSLFGFLSCLFGLVSGLCLDGSLDGSSRRRLAVLLGAACAVYWASLLALAWCSTYGQFAACFVVAGISSAVPTTAAFVVVDSAFSEGSASEDSQNKNENENKNKNKKTGIAVGLVSTGAPLGGLLISLALRVLFAGYTWRVAMLWLSSMVGVLELVGCIAVARRRRAAKDGQPGSSAGVSVEQEQKQKQKQEQKEPEGFEKTPTQPSAAWRDLSHFTDRRFVMFTACVFFFEFVLYAQWGSLPYFAASTGVGDVFYIQMTYNLGAIPGRTVPPWIASRQRVTDKSRNVWPFDVTLAMTALTILTVFVLWVPLGDHSAVALYIVAFLMGIGTGSFVPLSATCISQICNGRGYGKWLGSCYAVVGFASLLGNPINQALLESTSPRFSVAFQGILLGCAFVLCLAVRRDLRRGPEADTAVHSTSTLGLDPAGQAPTPSEDMIKSVVR